MAGQMDDGHPLLSITEVIFNILEAIAKDQIPKDQDLDFLTEVLNADNGPIRFDPDGDDPAHWVREPYRRPDRPEVLFAKDLLDYMNLAARYGREHDICGMEGCGTLMMTGRGSKKFCSSECR